MWAVKLLCWLRDSGSLLEGRLRPDRSLRLGTDRLCCCPTRLAQLNPTQVDSRRTLALGSGQVFDKWIRAPVVERAVEPAN